MAITLCLGGARSGKSSFGESLFSASDPVTYVATARYSDPEFNARIARHQARRSPTWITNDTEDLLDILQGSGPLFIDDLGTWLSHRLDILGLWESSCSEEDLLDALGCTTLCDRLAAYPDPVVIISPEVGMGIAPAFASGRIFRDLLGSLNATIAELSTEVYFIAAGLPLRLK